MSEIISLMILVLAVLLVTAASPVILELGAFIAAHLVILPIRKLFTRKILPPPGENFRLAFIVPAHNESITIERCIKSLLAQEGGGVGFAVIVVADNCTDDTAERAAAAGARVLERNNLQLRGKGAALNYAFTTLLPEEFGAFVVIDADTEVPSDFARIMADHFLSGAEALQAAYLVRNPQSSGRTGLMNLALLSMNVFRPRGRELMGLTCGIFGNGFGLSRSLLMDVPYEANSLAEDLEYHLRLVEEGRRVRFIPEARVYADFPTTVEGSDSQRARWEGGRFLLQRKIAPGLLLQIFKGRWRFLEPLLELLSLPLAYEVVLLFLLLAFPAPFSFLGLGGIAVIVLHIILSVVFYGSRHDWRALASIPGYVLWKLVKLPGILKVARKGMPWIRTKRDGEI